jgi:N-methylhydantoinase A
VIGGGRSSRRFHVGTDVGGTFTDLWAIADDGEQVVVKVPSTSDILGGLLEALSMAAERFSLSAEAFCASIERFGHGTTAGLNALLTGHGARSALITTAGFRDTLEIGRLKRQVAGLSDLAVGDYLNRGRIPPVVPRERVFEVEERIDREGSVVVPLGMKSVEAVLESLPSAEIEAVGICTLWSVVNPVHELRLAELVADRLPGVFVTLSHQIAPGIGEYARMSTTAVNAVLGPVMGRYLSMLGGRVRALGLAVPIQVMTGAGGVVAADDIAAEPVSALMSGPAAGVVASQQLGGRLGLDRLLSIDVGGTSFDVGVIVDGAALMRANLSVAGAEIQRPTIDVGTIGAGGGSIARVEHGVLAVGPLSAGAVPGPVCYGHGGEQVTATDADLVLGVLAEDGFAGGSMRLDRAAAEEAIGRLIGRPLGLSVLEAAWGIRRVLDSKMADLLRSVTIEKGHDPREFVLFANGGQGPSHAAALCRDLGIDTFVVAPTATAQSAVGTGTSDLRTSAERPCYLRVPPGHVIGLSESVRVEHELELACRAARSRLPAQLRDEDVSLERFVAIRYRGQANALEVPASPDQRDLSAFEKMINRFESQYEALFGAGAAFSEAGFEVLSVRAAVTGRLRPASQPSPIDPLVPAGTRDVVFDDPNRLQRCPVWRTEFPAPGQEVSGPCLVVFPGQSLVVPPGGMARTDEFGNFVVTVPLEQPPAPSAPAAVR